MRERIEGDGFYILFLGEDDGMLAGTGLGAPPDGETALCIPNDKSYGSKIRYLILKGNFVKQYGPLVPQGLQACIDFFKSQMDEHKSGWSDDLKTEDENGATEN